MQQTTNDDTGISVRRIRQARLKPEYGFLYPGIDTGVWVPAARVADQLLAHCLIHGRDAALTGRRLIDAHFEFRGGSSQGGERAGIRRGLEVIA
ncbi:MAG TPA: hypothetical protein VFH40_02400 [Gemmatimonadales bacterium]|jgi:hypothetical protein|nr:hypothetical protein [Gemmatimonadales bacterium]